MKLGRIPDEFLEYLRRFPLGKARVWMQSVEGGSGGECCEPGGPISNLVFENETSFLQLGVLSSKDTSSLP